MICVGGFQSGEAMRAAISSGRCDAVAVARAMIANPYLFAHLTGDSPRTDTPVCGFHNGCVARVGGLPIDCYDEATRHRKDRMLGG